MQRQREIKTTMIKYPRAIVGIYYLWKGEQIVYIGKSRNVFMRVGMHDMLCEKDFDYWSYEEIPIKDLVKAERRAIEQYKPKYNRLTRSIPHWKTRRLAYN